MSKHAKPILIRFYRGSEEGRYALVKDWDASDGRAHFTLPPTSLLARSLMVDGLIGVRVIVMESEEIEWDIERIGRGLPFRSPSDYNIHCRSYVGRLRDWQPTDDYLLATFGVDQ